MDGLTEGRVVHYVLESGRSNDGFEVTHLINAGGHEAIIKITQNSIWRTSVHYSEDKEPGTWHWIEKA